MIAEKNTTLQSIDALLPPEYHDDLLDSIRQESEKQARTIVVLDDDPTGTQTLSDVPILTTWSSGAIEAEFRAGTPLFFILTNSRSMPEVRATAMATEIGRNILEAGAQSGRKFTVVSRSDSTLRGHYPAEVDHVAHAMEQDDALRIMIPAFFEGGRYTIGDVHYVQEGDVLIPAARTPFAEDKAFGYRHSNLRAYIEEKTNGRVPADEVVSFSLMDLRTKSPVEISEQLVKLEKGITCMVNARTYRDLEVFYLALLRSGRDVLLRSAASILPVMLGRRPGPLLQRDEMNADDGQGILIIAGSYVPTTTAQLQPLYSMDGLAAVEVKINDVLEQPEIIEKKINVELNKRLSGGEDVLLYTSRQLVAGSSPDESLEIGKKVSAFLTQVVQNMIVRPRTIIAKGGITSSEIATRGLGVRKAMVFGQIAPGIPVWKLSAEAKFPGLCYVVFPGNVGDENTLKEVYLKLKGTG